MAGVLNDWGCNVCGVDQRDRVLPSGEVPICCGEPMVCLWDHGKPPATDLHPPEFNHATGQYHQSTREAEMELAKMTRAWSERTGMKWSPPKVAGDKHHGARHETRPSNAAFGYSGQRSRRSTGERGDLRDPGVPVKFKTRRREGTSDSTKPYEVNGISPRRMTREEAARERGRSL